MMNILFLVLIMIVSVGYCFAQEKETPYVSQADSNACELNSLHFDLIATGVQRGKERTFVIFRAGKSETDTINVKRLDYVKLFLEKSKGWEALDVIYARGEKTDKNGKIEFYIGGKLLLIVDSPKNKTPCLDCCDRDFFNPQNLLKKKTRRKS